MIKCFKNKKTKGRKLKFMERKFMKAMVLEKPCTAEEMKIKNVPIPEVKENWILVKIRAFGINRAEIFTRQGDSPSVKLPRVIGNVSALWKIRLTAILKKVTKFFR